MKKAIQSIKEKFLKDRLAFILETACDFLLLLLFICFPILSGSYPWNYLSVGVAGLFCLAVFTYIFLRSSLTVSSPMALLLWSLVVGAVSTLAFGLGSFDNLQTFAMLTILACAIGNYVAAFRKGEKCMILFVIGMAVFAFVFLFRYRHEILSLQLDRLGSDFENVNTVGFYMVSALAICLGLVITKRGKWHWFLLPAFAFAGIVLLTGSRASFLMIVLVLVTGLFLYFGKRRLWVSVLVLACTCAIAFLALQLPVFTTIRDRLLSTLTTFFGKGDGNYDYSGIQRFNMIVDGLRIWLKNAFFGCGLGSFASLSAYGTYSHATLTEALVSFGLVGTVPLFVSYLLPMLWYGKSRATASAIGLMMFIGVFLPGLFLAILFLSKSFYIVLGILLGEDALKERGSRYSIAFVSRNDGRLRLSFRAGFSCGNGLYGRRVEI